jgi:hypothetical protein
MSTRLKRKGTKVIWDYGVKNSVNEEYKTALDVILYRYRRESKKCNKTVKVKMIFSSRNIRQANGPILFVMRRLVELGYLEVTKTKLKNDRTIDNIHCLVLKPLTEDIIYEL